MAQQILQLAMVQRMMAFSIMMMAMMFFANGVVAVASTRHLRLKHETTLATTIVMMMRHHSMQHYDAAGQHHQEFSSKRFHIMIHTRNINILLDDANIRIFQKPYKKNMLNSQKRQTFHTMDALTHNNPPMISFSIIIIK